MLKVLIADDERVIRETISKIINWESLGLALIGQCKNGIEAYDMILDNSPDIVLTDIQMPGLGGIELVEKVSGTDLDTQFILLSGYGEFSYARDAMKHGVRHYLLKPCNEDQLINSLQEVREECYRRRTMRQLEKEQSLMKYTLQSRALFSILMEAISAEDDDRGKIYSSYEQYFDFTGTSYEMSYLYGLQFEDLPDCYRAIWDYHRQHAPGLPLHGIYVHDTLMVFCQDYRVERESIDALMENLSQNGEKTVFTRKAMLFPNLKTLLDEILTIANHYGTIYYMDGLRPVPAYNYRGAAMSVKQLCDDITRCAEPSGHKASIDALVERINSVANRELLLQLCSAVLLSFSEDSVFCTPLEAVEWMVRLQKIEDMKEIKQAFTAKLGEMLRSDAEAAGDDISTRIRQYVCEHLSDPDMTLKYIAENVLYMNVDYVSKCFVRETGKRFSTYLTEVRVQQAKTMFAENAEEKIQTVAEQVGCGNNPQYFSLIFKKATGMTPSAYVKDFCGK